MANSTDRQLTGMAGEFLVAGKLFKMGLQVSITLGNAKSIDLLAHNTETGENFNIQVKTLRHANCFDLDVTKMEEKYSYIYIFVILGGDDPVENERYFVVPWSELNENLEGFFGKSIHADRKTVNYGPLKIYENKWEIFKIGGLK